MSASLEQQEDQRRTVALLAEQAQVPVEDVAKLYEHEHAALAVDAHITTFLDIFAVRNVREILRKRGIELLAMPAAVSPVLAAKRLLLPAGPIVSAGPAAAEHAPLQP